MVFGVEQVSDNQDRVGNDILTLCSKIHKHTNDSFSSHRKMFLLDSRRVANCKTFTIHIMTKL